MLQCLTASVLRNPSLYPIQTSLDQLQPYYLSPEGNTLLNTNSSLEVLESNEVYPKPPLIQAEQPQLSQSLLITHV